MAEPDEADQLRASESRPAAELWKNSLAAVIGGVKLRKVERLKSNSLQRPTLKSRDSIFDLIQIAVGASFSY
jgi:hypothetical protein